MNTTTELTIKYENPPIDEIVCGISFDPIKELRSGHFGILWQKFKQDFPMTEDQIIVGPVDQKDLGSPDKFPLPRVWFIHENENELIQVQRNRFLHNWRKRRPDDQYPGYEKVVENFEKYLSRFEEFLLEENLGNLLAKKYELTYIDLMPKGQGWENPGDLEKIFPNLLSLTKQGIPLNAVRNINWQIILNLPNNLGQLMVSIRNAQRVPGNQQIIYIESTAVSSGSYKPIRGWFNTAHKTIGEFFSNLVSNEIQEKFWGRKS